MGGFLSEDPIWNANLYGYVENNPLNKIDADGRVAQWLAGAVVGGVVGVLNGIGGAIKSVGNAYKGVKYAVQGDYRTANHYLDLANRQIWGANGKIVFGMAEGAAMGKIFGGYNNSTGKWVTKILGKTGLAGKVGLGTNMATAKGIFVKNLGQELVKDKARSVAVNLYLDSNVAHAPNYNEMFEPNSCEENACYEVETKNLCEEIMCYEIVNMCTPQLLMCK